MLFFLAFFLVFAGGWILGRKLRALREQKRWSRWDPVPPEEARESVQVPKIDPAYVLVNEETPTGVRPGPKPEQVFESEREFSSEIPPALKSAEILTPNHLVMKKTSNRNEPLNTKLGFPVQKPFPRGVSEPDLPAEETTKGTPTSKSRGRVSERPPTMSSSSPSMSNPSPTLIGIGAYRDPFGDDDEDERDRGFGGGGGSFGGGGASDEW
jgi:uncharacterized membrane protein YgcG